MAEHVRWLSRHWDRHISVVPNAGLPELVDGKTHYPLGPNELATWLERFVTEEEWAQPWMMQRAALLRESGPMSTGLGADGNYLAVSMCRSCRGFGYHSAFS